MNNNDLLFLEGLISYSLFAILSIYSNELKNLKRFFLIVLITLFICTIWSIILDLKFRMLIVPVVFIVLFHPLRLIFIRYFKKDPVIYIRGVHLTDEEKKSISIIDVLFTILMIFIPFFSPFLFAEHNH